MTAQQFTSRVVKIGTTKVPVAPSMLNLSIDELRNNLKAQYPEVAEAQYKAVVQDGVQLIEFLPRPGRKG